MLDSPLSLLLDRQATVGKHLKRAYVRAMRQRLGMKQTRKWTSWPLFCYMSRHTKAHNFKLMTHSGVMPFMLDLRSKQRTQTCKIIFWWWAPQVEWMGITNICNMILATHFWNNMLIPSPNMGLDKYCFELITLRFQMKHMSVQKVTRLSKCLK